jgi:HSP20 family protein
MARNLLPWRQRNQGDLARSDEFRDPFAALQNRIERAFSDVWSGFGGSTGWGNSGRSLASTDICETDKEIEVCVDLPGFEEKDIDVSVDDGALTIRAETTQDEEEKRKDYVYTERRRGSVYRTIPLPEGVDRDQVTASYDKGVLTVRLPKSEASRSSARHIPLNPPQGEQSSRSSQRAAH